MPNFRSPTAASRSIAGVSQDAAFAGLVVSVQEFARNPRMVGSAFPASHWLIEAVLAPLDWSRIRLIVEYGPGTGRFTRAILERLQPGARLVALETGTAFVDHLRQTIADPRLVVLESPAQAVGAATAEYGAADWILSGIPFSTLPPGEGEELMRTSCAALAHDGQFIAYQMRRSVLAPLRRHFRRVRRGHEWRNIPPCHIYWASEKR